MEHIVNYRVVESHVPIVKENSYVIKQPTKFKKWVVRILLKLNIIENEIITEIKYTRVEIHKDKIVELIRELIDDIYYSNNKEPRQVIIGYNKMRQLDIEVMQEMRFNMPLELNGSEGRKIFGLDIMMNPRIDGLVLI